MARRLSRSDSLFSSRAPSSARVGQRRGEFAAQCPQNAYEARRHSGVYTPGYFAHFPDTARDYEFRHTRPEITEAFDRQVATSRAVSPT
jgi:hypothetical protein